MGAPPLAGDCTALTEAGLQIAPSTYYASKVRPPSQRARQDLVTTEAIRTLHAANYGVYGAKKVHAELRREGHVADRGDGPRPVARCTVERLMRAAGLRGITRSKGPRTTIPGDGPDHRPDLVDRNLTATGPNQLWVADITYCRTFAGWVYAAFVVDVFSRRVVGWQLSKSLRTDLALDALEMGIWTRQHAGHDVTGLTHHSDKGVQYVAVRYTHASPRPAPSPRSAPRATATTTPWPRPSTPCSRPSWSETRAPGSPSTTSRSPSLSTSTGSTTDACTARSASSHRRSSRPPTSPQPTG